MEKNLTIKEEKRARNLKTKFNDVHSQIQGVQFEIELLNKRAKEILNWTAIVGIQEGLAEQVEAFIQKTKR
mgnify:CR=1 FL=1